jgi:hypothetical protein
MASQPYCLAMVLCDSVHRDPATGKNYILGTCNNVFAPTFPAQIALAVYFSLTDGFGPTTIRLQVVSADADPIDATNEDDHPERPLLAKMEMNLENPLMVVEAAIRIGATLPHAGLYHCELWAGSEVLMSRRLIASQPPAPGESES